MYFFPGIIPPLDKILSKKEIFNENGEIDNVSYILKIRRLIFQKITQQIYFKFEKRNICVPINYYFVFKKTPYV